MLGCSFFGRGLTRICLIWENDGGDGRSEGGREGAKKDERESLTSTNTRVACGGRDMCVQVRRKGARWLSWRNFGIARPPAHSATTAPNGAHFKDDLSSAAHLSNDPSEIAIMCGSRGGGGMSMGICGFI